MSYSEESAPTATYKAGGEIYFTHPVTGVPSQVSLTMEISAYDQYGTPIAPELGDVMFQHFINHLIAMPPIPGVEETSRALQGTKTSTRAQTVLPDAPQ